MGVRIFFYGFFMIDLMGKEGINVSNRTRKLAAIALERGEPLEVLIPRVVRETGSANAAARELDVAQGTILYWMKKLGYKAQYREVVVWEKVEEGQES